MILIMDVFFQDVESENAFGFMAETREFCRGSKNISVVDILEHINKKKEAMVYTKVLF